MQNIILLYDTIELLNVHIHTTYLKGQFHSCNPLQGTGKQLDSRSPGKEIYELIFEDVKPEYWKKYVEHQGDIIALGVWQYIVQLVNRNLIKDLCFKLYNTFNVQVKNGVFSKKRVLVLSSLTHGNLQLEIKHLNQFNSLNMLR